ncbi:MAG: hypothetical protein JRI63_09375 [Deltaproteobacteria bacterium]|nr:hypothetical protein [Deltaproteobacteria bacterium]
MGETNKKNEKHTPVSREEACRRVAELYNAGNNCDKAVFLALQELSLLPSEHWDFMDLYTDKPDTEHFLCRVFAAGIIAVYLDILTRRYRELGMNNSKISEPVERVNNLMNALLKETADGEYAKLETFDPFQYDTYLQNGFVTETMREEFRTRAKKLSEDFQKEFNCSDCVDVLGFDPYSYELYDEDIQEEIEKGEWMKECVKCMKHIIRTF